MFVCLCTAYVYIQLWLTWKLKPNISVLMAISTQSDFQANKQHRKICGVAVFFFFYNAFLMQFLPPSTSHKKISKGRNHFKTLVLWPKSWKTFVLEFVPEKYWRVLLVLYFVPEKNRRSTSTWYFCTWNENRFEVQPWLSYGHKLLIWLPNGANNPFCQ